MPYGKIDCFDLSSRKWTKYVNRVKQFIELNEIKESLHVATLITVVGEPTYDLMCDLCAPDKPESKKFTELVTIVEQHLEPRRSDIAERHIFRLRRQKPGEELSLYLQSLKHLASTCNFGEKLEENLRDQFVSGLAGDEMRSRLFAEKDLDYKRAVELTLALEAAERHAETSGSASAVGVASAVNGALEPPVHRIGNAAHQARGSNQNCWRCGRQHQPDKCRYRRYNCDKCGARGHLKTMCQNVRSSGNSGDRVLGKSQRRNQFYIGMDSESEDSDFFNIVVDGEDDKPYVVSIMVNDIPINFEVDTGSKISAINERDYQKYFKDCQLSKSNLRFKGYTGGKILPIGSISTTVCYTGAGEKREAHDLTLYVIPDGGPPLLGRAWLRKLKLKNIEIQMIVPKANKKRFSLSCAINDVPTIEKSSVSSKECKELPVAISSKPEVAAYPASPSADLSSNSVVGTDSVSQQDEFELAPSSPVPIKGSHYLRPRPNRQPYYK